MPTPSVAIRLGTDGKAQVKSDFAEVRKSGEDAMQGIATAADQAAEASSAADRRPATRPSGDPTPTCGLTPRITAPSQCRPQDP